MAQSEPRIVIEQEFRRAPEEAAKPQTLTRKENG